MSFLFLLKDITSKFCYLFLSLLAVKHFYFPLYFFLAGENRQNRVSLTRNKAKVSNLQVLITQMPGKKILLFEILINYICNEYVHFSRIVTLLYCNVVMLSIPCLPVSPELCSTSGKHMWKGRLTITPELCLPRIKAVLLHISTHQIFFAQASVCYSLSREASGPCSK